MAWTDWIVEKLNPAQPSIALSSGTSVSSGVIVDYKKAYKEIDVINRSVEMIINACMEIPFEVQSANGRGPTDRLNRLLNKNPNPFEDRNKLLRRAFLDLIIEGNCFFYYDKTSYHLYVLPAEKVAIVPDKRTFINSFKYNVGSNSNMSHYGDRNFFRRPTGDAGEAVTFTTEEIIHIRLDNYESIYRGASRLRGIHKDIELYYSLTNFQQQFFQNNAIPGLVLTTEHVLSKAVKDRLLAHWSSAYNAVKGGGRNPAILDGGLKIDKLGLVNFHELDFESSVARIQEDMAKGLGVPFILLKSGNNANLDANQKLFYLHTVVPILSLMTSAFQLFFGPNVDIFPDKKKIEILQPDLKTQAMYWSTLANSGLVTPNEARAGLGMAEMTDQDMDKIRLPQNIVGSASNPSTGGRPPE